MRTLVVVLICLFGAAAWGADGARLRKGEAAKAVASELASLKGELAALKGELAATGKRVEALSGELAVLGARTTPRERVADLFEECDAAGVEAYLSGLGEIRVLKKGERSVVRVAVSRFPRAERLFRSVALDHAWRGDFAYFVLAAEELSEQAPPREPAAVPAEPAYPVGAP